jgi:hypothetical protein
MKNCPRCESYYIPTIVWKYITMSGKFLIEIVECSVCRYTSERNTKISHNHNE